MLIIGCRMILKEQKREEYPKEEDELIKGRVQFLGDYTRMAISLHNLGTIGDEKYDEEMKWLDNATAEIEGRISGEEERNDASTNTD